MTVHYLAEGIVRSAIGKANLLMEKKFCQFRGLCQMNIVSPSVQSECGISWILDNFEGSQPFAKANYWSGPYGVLGYGSDPSWWSEESIYWHWEAQIEWLAVSNKSKSLIILITYDCNFNFVWLLLRIRCSYHVLKKFQV